MRPYRPVHFAAWVCLAAVIDLALAACARRRAPPRPRPSPTEQASSVDASPRSSLFTGLWERGLGRGSRQRNESLLLFPDGTFERRVAGYELMPEPDCALDGAPSWGGTWRMEESTLVLETRWKDRLEGGLREAVGDAGAECRVRGARVSRVELNGPQSVTFPLDRCDAAEGRGCLLFDGAAWYRSGLRGQDPRDAWYAFCATARLPVCDARR